MKMKKIFASALAAVMVLSMAACGSTKKETEGFDTSKEIGVISREDGSGTRGAFIELFGIEQKNAEGVKVDRTTASAVITKSTSVMLTTVSGDEYAIGYTSLGSLNDTVKAVKINGADASVENIKNGSYKISRPFNIATKPQLSEAAQDFISFVMSSDGQSIIESNGYISVSEAGAYTSSVSEGKVVISGSSSVTPVMEKLTEAYKSLNPNVEIQLQTSDSSTGITDAIDGISDIGMASRALKDSELEKGVVSTTIAMDGIAVVVNHANTVEDMTTEQVMKIFTGEVTLWSEIA